MATSGFNLLAQSQLTAVTIGDDIIEQFVLYELLQRIGSALGVGVNVVAANNGVQGLGDVFIHRPDITVLNANLPRYSGRELVEFLATSPEFISGEKLVVLLSESDLPPTDFNTNLPTFSLTQPAALAPLAQTLTNYIVKASHVSPASPSARIYVSDLLLTTVKFNAWRRQLLTEQRQSTGMAKLWATIKLTFIDLGVAILLLIWRLTGRKIVQK